MEKLRHGPEREDISKNEIIVQIWDNSNGAMLTKNPRAPYSLEIVDDICRVAPSKLGHRDIDLLIVVLDVNLDIFVQFQLPLERRIQRVFIKDAAVKHALAGKLWE